MRQEADPRYYSVIVFENEKDREAFYKAISVPKFETNITEEQVRRLVTRSYT